MKYQFVLEYGFDFELARSDIRDEEKEGMGYINYHLIKFIESVDVAVGDIIRIEEVE